jgi:hypothetical protein
MGKINFSLNIQDFFKKFKNSKKVLWFLGKHIFFVILLLIIFDLLIGGFLIYKYAFLVKPQDSSALEKNFKFNEVEYQQILKILEAREKEYNEASGANYSSPFRSKTTILGQPKIQ